MAMRTAYFSTRVELILVVLTLTVANPLFAQTRLGYWRFNSTNLAGEQWHSNFPGVPVKSSSNVQTPQSWSGKSVKSIAGSYLSYPVINNGREIIKCQTGSIRMWFKPDWNTGAGPNYSARLLEIGSWTPGASGWWGLYLTPGGTSLQFGSQGSWNTVNYCGSPINWTAGSWHQITLTYTTGETHLYLDGVHVNGTGWGPLYVPDSATRSATGFFLGSNSGGGDNALGEIEEFETFDYPLSSQEIANNYQRIASTVQDSNQIPDLLEDKVLPVAVPFSGTLPAIPCTIEAEQFDFGGNGTGYFIYNGANPNGLFRTSQVAIAACSDIGCGYCVRLDGPWISYSVTNLESGIYNVDFRTSTPLYGDPFHLEINGVATSPVQTPNPIPPPTEAPWITSTLTNVYLPAGKLVIKLVGNSGKYFNYFTIYKPLPSINIPSYTTSVSLSPNPSDAAANRTIIQTAVENLRSMGGGTLNLPAGIFYLDHTYPDSNNPNFTEQWGATRNMAIYINSPNIKIKGVPGPGPQGTQLRAVDRCLTLFYVGSFEDGANLSSNVVFQDIEFYGRPEIKKGGAPDSLGLINRMLLPWGDSRALPNNDKGMLLYFCGTATQRVENILVQGCKFVNFSTRGTQMVLADNATFLSNSFKCYEGMSQNTYDGFFPDSDEISSGVGIFSGAGVVKNIRVIRNSFNGNVNMTTPSQSGLSAADGLLWLSQGGNWLVSDNVITNYRFEGIQLAAGPSTVVRNQFNTKSSNPSSVAINAFHDSVSQTVDSSTSLYTYYSFIGNNVVGGTTGFGVGQGGIYGLNVVNVSGNSFILGQIDSAAVVVRKSVNSFVSGNTVANAGKGFHFLNECKTATLWVNDFTGAKNISILGQETTPSMEQVVAVRNKLSIGNTAHVLIDGTNSDTYLFLMQNTYYDSAMLRRRFVFLGYNNGAYYNCKAGLYDYDDSATAP